jgi:hypothetical protein
LCVIVNSQFHDKWKLLDFLFDLRKVRFPKD